MLELTAILASPAVGVQCGQGTLKACEQIHMLIAELFELAKSERAGALCVVLNKATANSATDPALHGVSYDWGSLNSVLCSAGHSAVVATFLEGSTTYRSRVQLTTVPAGGVSHDGILPFVTASASDGSVCYHHMGVSWVHANYDFILAELLSFLGLNNAFQLVSSSSHVCNFASNIPSVVPYQTFDIRLRVCRSVPAVAGCR